MPSQQAWTEDSQAENSLFPYAGQLSFSSIREPMHHHPPPPPPTPPPHTHPSVSCMEPSRCWSQASCSPSRFLILTTPTTSWFLVPFTIIFLSSSVHTPLGQHFAIRGSQLNFAV